MTVMASTQCPSRWCRRPARALALALVAGLGAAGGCAALTNPAAVGVPVRLVPPELLAPSKAGEQTVPLNLLGQPHRPEYLLGPGDVLGVYIDGFLGERNLPPPVHIGFLAIARDQRRLPPS